MAHLSTPDAAHEATQSQHHVGARLWPNILSVAALVAIIVVVLLAMGREPWCSCGYTKIWHGVVRSSGNSQHLTDWYTFAHLLDGFGFYLALALIGRIWLLPARLTLATTLAVAWEIFENTDFVIDHYRVATLALGYRGDSIVNAVGDVLACTLGFLLAAGLPVRMSVALGTGLTVIAAWVILGHSTPTLMLGVRSRDEVVRVDLER
jgi:Protein of unknown function (DUF2585)